MMTNWHAYYSHLISTVKSGNAFSFLCIRCSSKKQTRNLHDANATAVRVQVVVHALFLFTPSSKQCFSKCALWSVSMVHFQSFQSISYSTHIELLQIIVQFCFKLHVFHTYFTDSVPETDLLNIAIVSATHFCNAALHFTSTTF